MKAQVPILVVGGGPAGAATAIHLARRGWPVELVERRRGRGGKACGECLNPAGVQLLERLGVPAGGSRPVLLHGWDIAAPGRLPARGRFARGDVGMGIERARFDGMLLDEARRAGVRVRTGTRVIGASPGTVRHPAEVTLRLPGGERIRRSARLLIGADGLHSRLRAAAGLGSGARPPHKASLSWRIRGRGPSRERGRLMLGPGITAGLAPVGDAGSDRWNATLVVGESRRSGPQSAYLRREGWAAFLSLFETWTDRRGGSFWEEGPQVVDGPWASGSFHRPVTAPARGRTLLVGDAAGYFDPLTGQGIHRALLSAELAAAAVEDHLCLPGPSGCARAAARELDARDLRCPQGYARRLRRALAGPRWLQHGIEAVVSRRPTRRGALGTLARLPRLTSALVRCAGDRPRTALASTGTLLRPESHADD